jgi:hypothetical protein
MTRRNLTPDELRQAGGQGFMTPEGWIIPMMGSFGGSAGNGGEGASQTEQTTLGYGLYDPNRMGIGDAYGTYDAQGNYKGDTQFRQESDGYDLLLAGLLAAGGMHWLLPGAAGAAGAGGAGAGFMGPVTAGEAAAQSAALHSSLAPYAAGAGGAAGGAAGGMMGPPTAPTVGMGEVIPGLESYVTPMVPTPSNMGPQPQAPGKPPVLPGLEQYVTGGAGALGGLLGPIASVGGALAGAAGGDNTQTAERKMDPRLDGMVYGDLLPRVQGLLGQQMPIAQQQGDQLRNLGTSLMNIPLVGNGFSRFSSR